jgi:putative transposase
MTNPFRYFKTSPEIIRLTVMTCVRFPLSLRNVEDLLHERGIDVSHETVRFWWNRFGPRFAAEIRHGRTQRMRAWPQRRWHLDDVFGKINVETHYLWRAVDHEGEALESFVTKKRDCRVTLRFLKKAMKRFGHRRAIVADRLRSYRSALRELGNEAHQETGRWLNNRAENSYQPLRRREKATARFRSPATLQKFASIHASVHNHFNQARHLYRRDIFKQNRASALSEWRNLCAA